MFTSFFLILPPYFVCCYFWHGQSATLCTVSEFQRQVLLCFVSCKPMTKQTIVLCLHLQANKQETFGLCLALFCKRQWRTHKTNHSFKFTFQSKETKTICLFFLCADLALDSSSQLAGDGSSGPLASPLLVLEPRERDMETLRQQASLTGRHLAVRLGLDGENYYY